MIQVRHARRAELHGQIAGVAQAGAGAGLVLSAGAGIERPAVDREEADVLVGIEHVLRAVAVVHVPVDDQHAVEPVLRRRHAGRDRDVVEQAKAHGAERAAHDVRAAGTRHKAWRSSPPQHAIDGIAGGAGGQQGHVVAGAGDDRVRFDPPPA